MQTLKGKTVFITGGSRGIGRSLAIRCGAAGANVVIAAKSTTPHPKLGGSIYTVAEEVIAAGGQALPLPLDVRDEQQVASALSTAAEQFAGIDVLVNNAGAIHLGNIENTSLKQYDLIQSVNHRATFICAQHALPYLKKSAHAHILSFAPPINLTPHWLGQYAPYALSKYGMTLLTLGLAEELKQHQIQCNTLWPVTLINTAAVSVNIGEAAARQFSRRPEMMSDAAFAIISGACGAITGQSLLDEQALTLAGITDFANYACSPEHSEQLAKDLFVD